MSFDEFCLDKKTIDAVVRNFEIIGEAANQLPLNITEYYNEINWNRIRGFRNRLIHEYFGVDFFIVWSIIQAQIKYFKKQVEDILTDLKKL